MNAEDKRVITKQLLESKYARVNKLKEERERRKTELEVCAACGASPACFSRAALPAPLR
jgi:hypothetical protein